jgi:ketosteroid isomerase-like protein
MHLALYLTVILLQITPQPPAPAIHSAIPPVIPDDRFVRDLHDKNLADVLTLYTPDAVFVDPDGHRYSGPTLRKLYEQVTASFDSDLHLKRLGLTRTGNLAIEHGAYTETLRARGTSQPVAQASAVEQGPAQEQHIHGTYRFTAQLQPDGRWLFTKMEWTLAQPN